VPGIPPAKIPPLVFVSLANGTWTCNNLRCFLQIEGAFVQGIGFFMLEEYLTNSNGLVVVEGKWTYKIPTLDTIPKQFNVQILNSGHHKKRVLSLKGMFLQIFAPYANGFY
jgi:xanthine dehydrogenase molybdopterin-binding subunit B